MVSSSHKPYFIYGQKVIDSVVGTPSINAHSCNFWEIYILVIKPRIVHVLKSKPL